jgi:uncharacterized repeat protein (TIGR02543 family)
VRDETVQHQTGQEGSEDAFHACQFGQGRTEEDQGQDEDVLHHIVLILAEEPTGNTVTEYAAVDTSRIQTENRTNNYTPPITYITNDKPQPVAVTSHTVQFETNGGPEIKTQTINNGYKIARPNDPKKEGFLFDGWYKDPEFTEPFDFQLPVNEDLTIYAKWKEKPEEMISETIQPSEPEKKPMTWVWITVAGLGAAGIGTCLVLLRKDEEE